MGRRKEFQPVKSAARGLGGGSIGFGSGAAGFGGSAGFGGAAHPLASSFSDEAIAADPLTADLQQHLKRLAKKDATTKRKALAELVALIDDTSDEGVTRAIIALPQWCYMYTKLSNDATLQVREAAHTLMGLVARVVKAELEPHIPTVLPRWWIANFDPRAEARQSAESALIATFPGRRINKALRMCHKPLFAELKEIFESSPQTVVDIKAVESLDVAKEMYERQVHCGLLALGRFVEKVVEVDKFDDKLRASVSALLKPAAFWRLADSKFAEIRLGFLKLLPVLCQHMTSTVDENLDNVAPSILGAMSDKATNNYLAIWPAILQLVKALPRSWAHVDVHKVVLPRMCSCLRAAAYGSWAVTYPAVLPWLSVLPRSMVTDRVAAEICDALWFPITTGAVPSAAYQLIATAWAECAAHLIGSATAAAESESKGLSAADVSDWVALPTAQKPDGKPTPEQIAELKAAKLARSAFLQKTANRLGVEWTPKMVQQQLEQLQLQGHHESGEPEPAVEPHGDPSEEFYRGCLLNPSMKRLSEAKPKVIECWAIATATQITTRPVLQLDHVERLLADVAATAIDAVSGIDAVAAAACVRWFVPLVRCFYRESYDALATRYVLQLAQNVANAAVERSGQDLPHIVTLDLLAGLTAPPLSFQNVMPTDGPTTHDTIIHWLRKTTADSVEQASVVGLLNSYLTGIDDPTTAAAEWESCVSSISDYDGGSHTLLQLLRLSIDLGVPIPVGLPSLETLASSETFLQQLFGTTGQSVAELLLLMPPLVNATIVEQLITWLTVSLEQHSSEVGTALRNVLAVVDGVLSIDLLTGVGNSSLHTARVRLLTQIFVLQVPVTCPVGGLENTPLRTSKVCAARCEEMWIEHSPSLLEHAEGYVPKEAWTSVLPNLLEQILAMTLCSESQANHTKGTPIEACVKLASELLATSKCISSECLQESLSSLLKELVPALSSSYGITRQDSGMRWSRVLGFAVGLSSAIDPVDLFLGAEDDYREWLLLELLLFGGVEPVRVNNVTEVYLQDSVSSAKLLAECDLTEFWISCCQGTLSVHGSGVPKTAAEDFVLRTVNLAQELSVAAVDGRFAGLLNTLFPNNVGPSRTSTSLARDVIRTLDDEVIRPAQSLLLSSTDQKAESGALYNASAVLYSLIPHLSTPRAWQLTQACVERVCTVGIDKQAETVQHAATMLLAGYGIAIVGKPSVVTHLDAKPKPTDATQLHMQTQAAEVIESPEGSDDSAFDDANDCEELDQLPTEAALRDCVQKMLSHVRRAVSISAPHGCFSTDAEALYSLGVLRLVCFALNAAPAIVDDSDNREQWEFYASVAIKGAIPVATEHNRSEWCTRTHMAGLELVAELLSKLPSSVNLLGKTRCEAIEDALSGVAYSQLVDESDWSPAVWHSLAAILPVWTCPERTVVVGYTDELVWRLSNPHYTIRCEVYKLILRLANAAIDDVRAHSDAGTEESEEDFCAHPRVDRPDLIPKALFDLIHDNAPNHDDLLAIPAYLFAWAIVLQMVTHAPPSLRLQLVEMVTEERCGQPDSAARRLLTTLISLLPLETAGRTNSGRKSPRSIGSPSISIIQRGGSASEVAAALFGCALRQLPAMSRKWFNTLSRANHMLVEKYAANMVCSSNTPMRLASDGVHFIVVVVSVSTASQVCHCATLNQVTPSIVKRELESMSVTARSIEGLEISASTVARQVTATYLHDDCNLGVAISLAEAHPLHVVDVNLTSHHGMSEAKSRKMLLSITTLLSHKDGSILEAITMWKDNLDKQFDGVEPCIICYSVIAHNGALPRLQCKTCNQCFHSGCLYKWFQQSSKSNCPHCQSPWI